MNNLSPQYQEGCLQALEILRFDNKKKRLKPTKSGHVWVEDKSVKGGGYWRKLPKNSGGVKAGIDVGTALGAATVVGLTGAAIYAATRNRPQSETPTPEANNFPSKRAIALGAGLAGVGVAGAVALSNRRRQEQEQPGGLGNAEDPDERRRKADEEYEQQRAARAKAKAEERAKRREQKEQEYKQRREDLIKKAEDQFESEQKAKNAALEQDKEIIKKQVPVAANAITETGYYERDVWATGGWRANRGGTSEDPEFAEQIRQERNSARDKFFSSETELPSRESFRNFLETNELKEDGFEQAKEKWLNHIGLTKDVVEKAVRDRVEDLANRRESKDPNWVSMPEEDKKTSKERVIKESLEETMQWIGRSTDMSHIGLGLKDVYDHHSTKSENKQFLIDFANLNADFTESFSRGMSGLFDNLEDAFDRDFDRAFDEFRSQYSGKKNKASSSNSSQTSSGKSWHDVLKVSQNADQKEVQKAFKKLIKEVHPDLNPNDPSATEKSREVIEAYEAWESLFGTKKDSFMNKNDAYKAGKQEIGLDLVPGLMPLDYVQGRLDAKKRSKKLQCRPGFEQRGAACQRVNNSNPKPNPALGVAAGLGAAALLTGGAIALANRNRQTEETPTPINAGRKVALAAGGTAAIGTAAAVAMSSRKGQGEQQKQLPKIEEPQKQPNSVDFTPPDSPVPPMPRPDVAAQEKARILKEVDEALQRKVRETTQKALPGVVPETQKLLPGTPPRQNIKGNAQQLNESIARNRSEVKSVKSNKKKVSKAEQDVQTGRNLQSSSRTNAMKRQGLEKEMKAQEAKVKAQEIVENLQKNSPPKKQTGMVTTRGSGDVRRGTSRIPGETRSKKSQPSKAPDKPDRLTEKNLDRLNFDHHIEKADGAIGKTFKPSFEQLTTEPKPAPTKEVGKAVKEGFNAATQAFPGAVIGRAGADLSDGSIDNMAATVAGAAGQVATQGALKAWQSIKQIKEQDLAPTLDLASKTVHVSEASQYPDIDKMRGFGQYLHHLGSNDPAKSEKVKQFMEQLKTTEAYKKLEKNATKARNKKVREDDSFNIQPEQVFGRAIAQYVAQKQNLQEQKRFLKDQAKKGKYWDEKEFKQIETAMDEMFKEFGWR